MKCPHCGAETPDSEWNCAACRMNVYWATRHYDELRTIREHQGAPETVPTPAFLVDAHRSAMEERAEHGGRVEHRVRQIARDVMRKEP
jgi:hypothetical protein